MDELSLAKGRLRILIKNLPGARDVHEKYVTQLHQLIQGLLEATGKDFGRFYIQRADLERKVIGYNYVTKKTDYSDDLYCERGIFLLSAESLLAELEGTEEPVKSSKSAPSGALEIVENLCRRFPLIVQQLKIRRSKPPLLMENEYDVQYLLHALLREHFEDVRDEEYTPSYAGSHKRMDFLLKREEIVIETKMTRDGLDAGKLGEELVIDINWYEEHKHCKTLVCLVYDPEGRIKNPAGLIDSLEKRERKIMVRVFIVR